MQVVIVSKAMYRGEVVEGTFNLVKDFSPFAGDVTHRRNGRSGTGFIKVMPEGDVLTRLAPNLNRPVKLSVQGEGQGYMVGMAPTITTRTLTEWVETEMPIPNPNLDMPAGLPAEERGTAPVTVFETFTPEFGVDSERELAEQAQAPTMDVALEATLQTLRAEFDAAKGRERDKLRKRLRRLEAKAA